MNYKKYRLNVFSNLKQTASVYFNRHFDREKKSGYQITSKRDGS